MANREHNLMHDAVAHAERAHAEYGRMQSDLASAANDVERLTRDNDLLRAELVRMNQRYEELKQQSVEELEQIREDCGRYERFAVTMTTKLALIDKVMTGVASTLSASIKDAVEASKSVAFTKAAADGGAEFEAAARQIRDINEAAVARGVGLDADDEQTYSRPAVVR